MTNYVCPYCGTECATAEALSGHMPLCDHNSVNQPAPIGKAPVPVETPKTEKNPSEKETPVLMFPGPKHAKETPEEVIKTDRSYVEYAASLGRDPAIRQRCKELLAALKP